MFYMFICGLRNDGVSNPGFLRRPMLWIDASVPQLHTMKVWPANSKVGLGTVVKNQLLPVPRIKFRPLNPRQTLY
jgi:hypothetical protein